MLAGKDKIRRESEKKYIYIFRNLEIHSRVLSRHHYIVCHKFPRISMLDMVNMLVEISGMDDSNKFSRWFLYILGAFWDINLYVNFS